MAWIAGLTGHNIAITSITATRRIAVGWIRPSSARAQPEANQPATSARSIHLYIRVTQTSWSNWLSDLKGAAFKQVLLNKPLTRETTLENSPLSAVSSPFLSVQRHKAPDRRGTFSFRYFVKFRKAKRIPRRGVNVMKRSDSFLFRKFGRASSLQIGNDLIDTNRLSHQKPAVFCFMKIDIFVSNLMHITNKKKQYIQNLLHQL